MPVALWGAGWRSGVLVGCLTLATLPVHCLAATLLDVSHAQKGWALVATTPSANQAKIDLVAAIQ